MYFQCIMFYGHLVSTKVKLFLFEMYVLKGYDRLSDN